MREKELTTTIEISGSELQAIMDCADSAFKQGVTGGLNTAAVVFQFAGKAENALRSEHMRQAEASNKEAASKTEEAKPELKNIKKG